MRRVPYTYVVLRYAHDPATGESLNVGVLIYAPEAFFIDVKFEDTYQRLSAAFSNFDGKAYHRTISEFRRAIERIREVISKPLTHYGGLTDAAAVAAHLWPDRGMSFKFGEALVGLTADLSATTGALFDRFVASQFTKRDHKRRDDADVWEAIEHKFTPEILTRLTPIEIKTKYFDHTFERSFRNEHLHVVEPISFDYVEPSHIIEAGTRWRGRLDVIAATSNERDGEFHFIVGSPKSEHRSIAERAMQMIRDAAITTEVVGEDAADLVVARVTSAVLHHN